MELINLLLPFCRIFYFKILKSFVLVWQFSIFPVFLVSHSKALLESRIRD